MTSDDAIPAATLVVWKDLPDGPQILVVERSARMAFAAGAIVFPGGRVDPSDRKMAAAYGRPDEAAKVTAIRETIEETGVAPAIPGLTDATIGLELQQQLHEGADFAELMSARRLRLDLEALTVFARWMPAFKQPRKFDTLFYLVQAPAGEWQPHPQKGECVAAEWASPAALIERIDRGEASAIFPTKRNLERLAQHPMLQAAINDARDHSIETIIPWVEDIDGEPYVRIPEGRGYPVISELLATAFRA
ncbi:MAG TPA: NUDIX domain-containing protein [Sphingomicrobium sp.]|nr:NUDIX domain-containing protein [Sphingomicrobium sp.]